MKRLERERFDYMKWLAVGLVTALAAVVLYALLGREQSDIAIHTLWAEQASLSDLKSFVRQAAHPLWRIVVFLVSQTGLSVTWSALVVTSICKGLETWALIALAQRLIGHKGWIAAACGLCTALVASIWVPWINPTVFLNGGSPNPWHSPTQIALMAPMLLSVSYTAVAAETFEHTHENIPWKEAARLSALLLISALIKPTFLQAFLPAAGLYFLVRWIQNPKHSAFFWRMLLVVLPAVMVIFLQYLFYFGGIVDTQGGITLLVTGEKALEVLKLVVLMQLFPLFAIGFFADKERLKKPLFLLTLLLNAVAIVQMLILSETGYRAQDGNFGWAVMGSSLMMWAIALPLYVFKLRAWLSHRKPKAKGTPYVEDSPRRELIKFIVGGVFLLWHLASGVWYVVYLLTTTSAL